MAYKSLFITSILGLLGQIVPAVKAFDNTRFDNLAVYWGQNSYGATHRRDTANFQKTLSFYCADDTIDAIPLAFLTTFFGTGGLPVVNFANICNNVDNTTFPGSSLADCSALASDITTCQAKGKIVTLSLGGASAGVGFTSDAQAVQFADQIWNLFLGGSSSTRPFGSAVLDGVDLDIEGGSTVGYPAFVNQLRTHFAGASKKYYITAAPQCVYPDASLGAVLNSSSFDAVYVQFYNNFCGLQNFLDDNHWNYGLWDNWARTISPNPNVKIYIGAPASSTAAGKGYVDAATLSSITNKIRNSFPSFGGVMMWDASQAFQNNRYDVAIKNSLVAAGGTGFTFPPCSAPAYVSGTSYTGGSQVSLGGYIWVAKFTASTAPASDPSNPWSAISACSGTATLTSSTHSVNATQKGGNCAGVAAWDRSVAYASGSTVTFAAHSWTAKRKSHATVPSATAGQWIDNGPCSTAIAHSGIGSGSISSPAGRPTTTAPTSSTKQDTKGQHHGASSRLSRFFRI